MSNFTDKKKEYLRITSRFLKELRLYDLWLKYCYDSSVNHNWEQRADKQLINPGSILGATEFTDYIRKYDRDIKRHGYYMYELVEFYWRILQYLERNPNVEESVVYGCVVYYPNLKKIVIE